MRCSLFTFVNVMAGNASGATKFTTNTTAIHEWGFIALTIMVAEWVQSGLIRKIATLCVTDVTDTGRLKIVKLTGLSKFNNWDGKNSTCSL